LIYNYNIFNLTILFYSVHTQIITQNGHSAGYGFVAYETLEQAQKAVELFHEKEYHERKLIVEIARPKVHGQPRSGRTQRGRGRGRRGRRGGRSKSRQPRDDEKKNEEAPEESQEEPVEEQETKLKSTSTRGGRRGRGRRAGRSRPRPTFTGEPSEDTLFVANLPFSFKDDDLKEIFKSFKIKSAHVVVRKSTGVSKGFGFVQLEDKSEQQRVLKEVGKVVVEERELSITVALSEPYKPAEETEGVEGAEEPATA
jgi:RNA recognition motif-containing protein